MFSILGSMRLRSRALYILPAMDVRVIPRKFLTNPRLPFWGEGEDELQYGITVSEQYVVEFSGLPYF